MSALLAGPVRRPGTPRGTARWLATVPFLALVLWACVALGTGRLWLPGRAAVRLWHGLPLAAASTLSCLVFAVPGAFGGPKPACLVPAWLACGVGAAGWSLVALPQSPWTGVARLSALLLPFMVLGLAGTVSATAPGLARAAAAFGAGPPARLSLLARAVLPGLVRASLVVAALGASLLAS